MEAIVTVCFIVLTIVFAGSLVALFLICRQKYCVRNSSLGDEKPILKYTRDQFLSASIAENGGLSAGTADGLESEFEDVLQLSPSIEKYLKEYDWVYEATGLVQHCLAILKISHQITDKLSALSFQPVHGPQEIMDEVREATHRVMPRVDDLVRTMYASHHWKGKAHIGKPIVVPLAPLLEARAAALVMAVNSLAIAFRVAYPRAVVAQWLKDSLKEMDAHLEALRQASEHEEQSEREKVEVLCPGSLASQPIPEEPEHRPLQGSPPPPAPNSSSQLLLPPPMTARRHQNVRSPGLFASDNSYAGNTTDLIEKCDDKGSDTNSTIPGSESGSLVC